MRNKELTETIVTRMTPELRAALKKDAEEYGRTESQSVRYYLKLFLLDSEDEVVDDG